MEKYLPLSVEQFEALKKELEPIKGYLAPNVASTIWDFCNKIRGKNDKAPKMCNCRGEVKIWNACVEELRQFVRDRSE